MENRFRLSVVIPLFNEESVLPQLLARVSAVFEGLGGGPHELIFVDDGSTDGTPEFLHGAAARDGRVVVVSLSRNYGHQAALTAGLEHASGDAVVLMDGDLQDTPEAIPDLVQAFRQGYDVAYAVRVRRKEGWLMRSCYAGFYWLISLLADMKLPRDAGDFCLMSRRVVEHLNRLPERHRYLRGLRAWVGFRQIGIAVERGARAAGKAKYSLRRLLRLAGDGIFSFSIVPLRLAALLGCFTVGFSVVAALYSLYAKLLLQRSPQGFTALAVSIAFFAGVQLMFLGVIGEYVGRIYEEVKRRPLYLVHEVISGQKPWTPHTQVGTGSFTQSTGGGAPVKP
jgi:dolichol-phosphate mannosyltransferase